MTETTEAAARHWLVDAVLGAGAALAAITVAHAALPDRPVAVARAAPVPAVRAAAVRVAAPVALVAFADPVPGREIISPFGLRQLPWEENGRLHEGVDIAAPYGAPVLLSADGVVVRAGEAAGYGRVVEVRHAAGLTSLYAHMGAVAAGLTPGIALKAGAMIGRIGSSGTSTGPHLHFELRDDRDRPLNPDLFLGHAFARADDLPLAQARRFPRGVRVAYVSNIPRSKRALMDARAEGSAETAGGPSVTVFYGDGRPHARFRVRSYSEPAAPNPLPTVVAPESPPA